MFDFDRWQEIFQSIRNHKLRTFLTALGVFWGIFMLVFLMGSGKGLENGVLSNIGDMATNSLYVWGNRTRMPYAGLQPGRRIEIKYSDLLVVKNRYKGKIARLAPRMMVGSTEIARNGKSGSYDVRGEVPDIIYMEPIDMYRGRFINQRDLDKRRKVLVIGRYIADLMFTKDEEVLGSYLKIRGIEFKIVGIFNSGRKGENGANDEKSLLMPLSTAQQVTNSPGRVHWAIMTMEDNVQVSEVEDEVVAFLKERNKVNPEDEQGIGHFNLEKEFKKIQGLFLGIRGIIWLVGIGSLLAGIIGVGNIMFIVVKERTKEIGVRKAMGATPRSIIGMILQEAVFITFVAGYIGLIVSTGLLYLVELAIGEGSNFFSQPEVDFPVALGALVILVVAGAITGFLPALQAARVNPVMALKDE